MVLQSQSPLLLDERYRLVLATRKQQIGVEGMASGARRVPAPSRTPAIPDDAVLPRARPRRQPTTNAAGWGLDSKSSLSR